MVFAESTPEKQLRGFKPCPYLAFRVAPYWALVLLA